MHALGIGSTPRAAIAVRAAVCGLFMPAVCPASIVAAISMWREFGSFSFNGVQLTAAIAENKSAPGRAAGDTPRDYPNFATRPR
jgi:hypothetical protein